MIIKYGSTRIVILINKYAIKLPNFTNYRGFLKGLLGNLMESNWNAVNDTRLAKILFKLPLGLLNVMEKAEPLESFNESYIKNLLKPYHTENDVSDLRNIVELKQDSFGLINNEIKIIDYGG